MAQHDYTIANQAGALVRANLNDALTAIVSDNSGNSAPTTTFAHMIWLDTTNNLIKRRNSANTAWVTVGSWDGSTFVPYSNGTALAVDQPGGVQSYDADSLKADTADTLTAGFGISKGTLSVSAGAVAVDLQTAQAFNLSVNSNFTLSNPTAPTSSTGGVWYIDATADASGPYTITLGSEYTDQSEHTLSIPANTTTRIWIAQRGGQAFDAYLEDLL